MPSTVGIVASGHVFSPLDLSPALWLDASDASTITASSGFVSQWTDKSGNGRNVTQGTGSAQPTTGTLTQNGLNVLSFDGSDYLTHTLSLAIPQPLTIFFVAKNNDPNNSGGGQGRILTGGYNFQTIHGDGYSGYKTALLYAGSFATAAPDAITTATFGQSSFIANGSSSQVWLNGVAGTPGNAGTNSFGPTIYVGSRSAGNIPLKGNIAEIIVYTSALSASNRQLVEKYLNTKWAVY